MKRPRATAIATGLIILLAVGAAVCWTFHFPFSETRQYRVLPPNAEAVSLHRGLPDRWTDFLRNPLSDAWLSSMGAEPGQPFLRVRTNSVDSIMAMLRGGPGIAAWSPSFGHAGRPALVGVAWAGGHAQLMRWGWLDQIFSDFTVERRPGGRRIWVQPQPQLGPEQTLSLAIHEGFLLAVVSADPRAIDAVVERVARGSREQTPLLPLPEAVSADDRLVWAVPPGRLPLFRGRLHVELTGLEPHYAATTLRAEDTRLSAFPRPSVDALLALPGLLGDMPSALAVGSLPLVTTAAAVWGDAMWQAALTGVGRHADPQTPVFLAASGGAFGGTVMRLRVPALWAGVAVGEPTQGRRIVQSLLDTLNARADMGLVAEPVGTRYDLHVLTPVGDSFYRRLARGERAAFAVKDGWLVIASSLDALERILEARTAGGGVPTWADICADTTVGLWADCAAVATLGRQALAGHALIQLLSGVGGERLDTPMARSVLNGLAALHYLRARGTLDAGVWQLDLEAGRDAR